MAHDEGLKVANFIDKIFGLVQTEQLSPNESMYAISYAVGVVIGRAESIGEDGDKIQKEVFKAIKWARENALKDEKKRRAAMDA